MKNIYSVHVFFACLVFLPVFLFAGGGGETSPASRNGAPFEWDMGFSDIEGNPVDFDGSVTMPENGSINIHIISREDSYCYVIFQNSGKRQAVVYSNSLLQAEKPLSISVAKTDGQEKGFISIIMTRERQADLEKLIEVYRQKQTRNNFNKIYSEISRLQRTLDSSYRPASIISGGSGVRGPGNVPSSPPKDSWSFSGQSSYVWTVAVEYQ